MPNIGKRVFSNNQDATFRDYLANKKGVEMMKYIKSTSKSNKIKFLSYEEFMNLTRTFSKNSNILGTDMDMKMSMEDKTTGSIYYEKILTHMSSCSICKENKNPTTLFDCNGIKNIIYAYENHFNNTEKNIYQKGIDLNRWCKKCDNSYDFPISDDYYVNEISKPKKCKCPEDKIRNPGRGRKPIFCSQCDKFIDICLCQNRWPRIDAIRHINRQSEAETFDDRNKKDLFI